MLLMPLLGAVFTLLAQGDENRRAANAYHVALLMSVSTFLSAVAAAVFTGSETTVVFEAPSWNVSLTVGLDPLSAAFVLLFSFLSVLSVVVTRKNITVSMRECIFLTLILEFFLLSAVCARDLFYFLAATETALIPFFLLLSGWGVEKREETPYRFGLYAMAGALFLMVAVFMLYRHTGGASFEDAGRSAFSAAERRMFLGLFLAAMAFKAPLFPFNGWLTDALTEAAPATGILISGAYSKLIFYAFLRFAVPLAGEDIAALSTVLCLWAAVSALYGGLAALVQEDMRKIAAFTHMTQSGFLAMGAFCVVPTAQQGVLFLTVAQSVSMAAFLLACGAVYQRVGYAGNIVGVLTAFPRLGTAFFVACLALIGFPPAPVFTGEVLIFRSVFAQSLFPAAASGLAVVLLYASFFRHFSRFLFGGAGEKPVSGGDLRWREAVVAVIIGVMFVYLMLTPSGLTQMTSDAARTVLNGGAGQ